MLNNIKSFNNFSIKFITTYNNTSEYNNFKHILEIIYTHIFFIWNFFKLIITAMSSQLVSIMSSAKTHFTVSEQSATAEKSHASSQFKIIRLIRKLEDLLLLKSIELYCKLWQELKLKMSKSLKMTCVIADNAHIAELINAVKTMISKQKQQTAAFMKVNMYTAVLWFRAAAAATESFSVCEVLTCLTREIVIRCSNIIFEDHVWSITQLVKKINKKKSQKMSKKVLIIRKLLSKNIIIIINMKKMKKQLKQNSSWLAAVSKKIQINWRRFSVMMHEMWVAALDCIK